MCVCKLLVLKEMGGAIGFEPTASWSRTKSLNPINALSGVAYGTRALIFPLAIVRNLSADHASAEINKWIVARIGEPETPPNAGDSRQLGVYGL